MVGLPSLTMIGLVLDAAGALTLVSPDFSRFERYMVPEEEEIRRLEQA